MDAEVSVSAVPLSWRLQKLTPKIEFLTSQVLPATAQLYCAFAQLSRFSKEQSLVCRELPSWRYSAFLFDTVIVYIL